MNDTPSQTMTAFTIGDDLYAVSVDELHLRISALKAEIIRLETELEKKSAERSAADALFAKPGG